MPEKELNQWQEFNLKNKDEIDRCKADPRKWSTMWTVCTGCGGRISYENLKFYKFEPTKVLCYSCQEKHCKLCGAEIEWRHTARGRWMPYNKGEDTLHPYTCNKRFANDNPPKV